MNDAKPILPNLRFICQKSSQDSLPSHFPRSVTLLVLTQWDDKAKLYGPPANHLLELLSTEQVFECFFGGGRKWAQPSLTGCPLNALVCKGYSKPQSLPNLCAAHFSLCTKVFFRFCGLIIYWCSFASAYRFAAMQLVPRHVIYYLIKWQAIQTPSSRDSQIIIITYMWAYNPTSVFLVPVYTRL